MKSKLIEQENQEAPWTYPGLFKHRKLGHVFLVAKQGGEMICVVGGKHDYRPYYEVFSIGHTFPGPDRAFNPSEFIQLKGKVSIEFDL